MKKKNLLIAGMAITFGIIGYKIAIPAQAQSAKIDNASASVINFNLPPHPGKLANETKLGVDSNNNGVRDEIEIYIAQKYGKDKEKFEKILKFIEKKQSVLKVSLVDDEAAKNYNIWADSAICLSKDLGIKISEAISINNDLTAQVFNNWDRQSHFQDIMLKSDQLPNNPENPICD